MNKFSLPPSPNWFERQIVACAPDNTLIYGCRSDLVILQPTPLNEPIDLKVISHAHKEKITCVHVSPNWNDDEKLAVTAGDDRVIRIWDITEAKLKYTNKGHTTRSDNPVGVSFCGSSRVVSVSELGFLIIWKFATDELSSLNILSSIKNKVTCLTVCPHSSWLAAIGFKNGLITVADLRQSGRIMYRFKRYQTGIVSLSWCPAPVNVFPEITFKKKQSKTSADKPKRHDEPPVQPDASSDVNSSQVDSPSVKSTDNPEAVEIEALLDANCAQNRTDEGDKAQIIASLLDTSSATVASNESGISETDSSSDACNETKECHIVEIKVIDESQPLSSLTPDQHKRALSAKIVAKINDVARKRGKCQDIGVSEVVISNTVVMVEHKTIEAAAVQEALNNRPEPDNSANVADTESSNLEEPADEICTLREYNKEYLLASSALSDNKIIIWRAGTDGAVQQELYLSPKEFKHQNTKDWKDYQQWITLCWVTPNCLLSSNHKTELLQWNFDKSPKNYNYHLVHHDHRKTLFNIVTPLKLYDTAAVRDWRTDFTPNVWTFGKDRLILNSSLFPKCEIFVSYETFVNSIVCMRSSPITPTRVAMALSDSGCRVWDLSRPQLQRIVMQNFDKFIHKVSSLAWHPTKENILAFGSLDGQVGLINTYESNTKDATRFIQHCHSPVLQLGWGPKDGDVKKFGLFVVINGKLLFYNADQPIVAPRIIDCVGTNQNITQLAWKPDFSMLAVGTKIGHVLVYNAAIEPLFTFYFGNKLIRALEWHMEVTQEDTDVSVCSNWLAVCTKELIVYDCTLTPNNDDKDMSQRIVCKLGKELMTVINGVAWSPHENGKLVVVQEIGIAQVWDIKTKTLLHTCTSLTLKSMTCVMWSPIDPDYIITSGKDILLQIWKLSENSPKPIEIIAELKSKRTTLKNGSAPKETTKKADESDTVVIRSMEQAGKGSRNKVVLSGLANCQDSIGAPVTRDLKRLFEFYYENKCEDLAEDDFDILKLFGAKEDFMSLLSLEEHASAKRQTPYSSDYIALWSGNIGDNIKQAIANKSVNLWHVAIAPLVSHQFWREVCGEYARQISENTPECPFAVASFYLAVHQVDEAIDVLCAHSKYREALAVAKCRLSSDSPRINDIIEKWAGNASRIGNYEVSAQCYIVLKRLEDAIMTLLRRNVPRRESLELCVRMAKHCGNKVLEETSQFKLDELPSSPEEVVGLKPLLNRVDTELKMQPKFASEFGGGDSELNNLRAVEKVEDIAINNGAKGGDNAAPLSAANLCDSDDSEIISDSEVPTQLVD